MIRVCILAVLTQVLTGSSVWGQGGSSPVTYEELFDDPYDINELYVGLIPVYGELFTTNINAGFGIEGQYYHESKFDFQIEFRKAYSKRTDLQRDAAEKNSVLDNDPKSFVYFEIGGTYHIVDREEESQSKLALYESGHEGKKLLTYVPDNILVPSKMRRIYGARLGGFYYQTSVDLNRVLEDQGLGLENGEGVALDPALSTYGNMAVTGLYLGGSLALIRNFAVKPDRGYKSTVSDQLFTAYFDFLIAPSVNLEDVSYLGEVYSTGAVKTSSFGARVGMDSKFNRELSWSYGAELGYRPSVQGYGFYALAKMSFPVYGTKMKNSRDAFGR